MHGNAFCVQFLHHMNRVLSVQTPLTTILEQTRTKHTQDLNIQLVFSAALSKMFCEAIAGVWWWSRKLGACLGRMTITFQAECLFIYNWCPHSKSLAGNWTLLDTNLKGELDVPSETDPKLQENHPLPQFCMFWGTLYFLMYLWSPNSEFRPVSLC